MRALKLNQGTLQYHPDFAMPEAAEGEALVRVHYAGICGTDQQLLNGYYEFDGIPGHEFVGEVISASNNDLIGKRIVAEINIACLHCEQCQLGLFSHCQNRQVIGIKNHDGVFAEYVSIPERNLHILPDEISDLEAVLIEPLAAALHILDQYTITRESRILLIGAGKLGQLIAHVIQHDCPSLTVLARQEQVQRLKQQGIHAIFNPEQADFNYDLVIEATGSPSGFQQAIQQVKPKGSIILKSTYAQNLQLNMTRIVVDEITIIGSRCGDFATSIRWLLDNKNALEGVVSEIYPLREFQQAFARNQQPDTFKIVFDLSA
ncbi:MAG: alcohol dehydrogenase catalytic domain-containing protein [Gammaproteobacteria bacterium]|nr:alcohol dehydrogenase catalytic domain-containing protein [Gammaproteobacteria bacterium]MDH5729522.1 alcohol dehydrogenase catalytic domain-containing protein [Gammaproteobacteria bacterium]